MAMRTAGRWVAKIRGTARHFTAGIENMMREAELEEMEQKWRAENDRIMREYPALEQQMSAEESHPPLPPPPPPPPVDEDQPPLPLGEPVEVPPEQRELP
jgi:sec-independent protein translocase protein TatB